MARRGLAGVRASSCTTTALNAVREFAPFDLVFADAAGGKLDGLDVTIVGAQRPVACSSSTTWIRRGTPTTGCGAARGGARADPRRPSLVAAELDFASGVIVATKRPCELTDGREQRLVFGEVADLYDRARPGYPESLSTTSCRRAARAGDPVLEVGVRHRQGDGARSPRRALTPDRARARSRHGVDRAAELRGSGRDRRGHVVRGLGRATPVQLPARDGGTVVALGAAGDTAARRRTPCSCDDGALALFWNRPDWPETPLRHAIDAAYERVAPELGARTPGKSPQDVGRRTCVEELAASDLFGEVTAIEHEWKTVYDRDALPAAARHVSRTTGSSTRRQRERLFGEVGRAIDDAGGAFPVTYVAELYLARRAALMDEHELRRRVASSPVARLATVRADGHPHVVPVCFARRRRPDRLGRRPQAEAHDVAAPARQRARASGRQPPRRPLRRRLDATLVGARRRHGRPCATPGPSTSRRSICWRRSTAQYRDLRPAGAVLEITASRWRGWSAE